MTTTLYQRLGGAEGIARLVDDVVAAHLANPIVKARYENVKDMDHVKRVSRKFSVPVPVVRRPTRVRTCSPHIKA